MIILHIFTIIIRNTYYFSKKSYIFREHSASYGRDTCEREPVEETNKPVKDTSDPLKEANQPVKDTSEPVQETKKPVKDNSEPVTKVNQSSQNQNTN